MKHGSDPADSAGQIVAAERTSAPESIETVLAQGLELLPRLREAGDPTATAELLYRMSKGFADLDLHLEAFVHASEAVDAAQGRGAELLLCRAACTLGSAQRELGLHEESHRTLLDTLRLARALDATDQMRDVLLELSQVATFSAEELRRNGDEQGARAADEKAGDYAEQALELIRQPGQPTAPGAVLCLLGTCLTASSHIEAARAALGDAHSHAIRHGDSLLKLRADAGLAEALWAEQAYAAALPLANQLLQSAIALREGDVRLRAQQLLYKVHKALGDFPRALEHLEQCRALQQAHADALKALQARWAQRRLAQEKVRRSAPRRAVSAPARDPWSGTSMMAMLDGGRQGSELAAIQDPITGLGNRRHVERELPRLLALSERRKSTLSIALIEVDHLRTINERFGRSVRDAVLKVMAELMQTHTRTADLIGRTGPDEFVLVLCDASREGAREACERLRVAVQDYAWDSIAASLGITVSVGLCEQGGKLNAARLLARADRALYFARRKGGNRIVMADETL